MISEQLDELSVIEEELRNKHHIYDLNSNKANKIKEAIITIKELSEKLHAESMERSSQYYNGGWIPCEDRLPTEYSNYLVTWKDKTSDKNYLEIVEHDPYQNGNPWMGDIPRAGKDGYEILAWMPLPKPYQPKEGE